MAVSNPAIRTPTFHENAIHLHGRSPPTAHSLLPTPLQVPQLFLQNTQLQMRRLSKIQKKHICIKPSTVILQACLYARQGNANFRHNCIHTTAMTLPSVINPCKCAHLYRCSHLLRGQMPHVEPQSSKSCRRPSRENLSSQDQSSSFAGGGPHG